MNRPAAWKGLCLFWLALFLISGGQAWGMDLNWDGSLSLRESYEDNVFLTKTGRKGDFITYIVPSISLSLDSKALSSRIRYSPAFSFYSNHEELNETTHRVFAVLDAKPAEKLRLTLNESFERSNEIRDQITVPGIGPIRERRILQSNFLTTDLTYSPTQRIDLILGGSFLDSKLENTTPPSSSQTLGATLSAKYIYNLRTSYFLTFGATRYDFENAPDADSKFISVGIKHALSPTLKGALSGGPILIHRQGSDDHLDFTALLEVEKRTQRGTYLLRLEQDFIAGLQDREPLRNRGAALSASWLLNKSLAWTTQGSMSMYHSLDGPRVDETMLIAGTGLDYTLKSWVRLLVSYVFIKFNDNVDGANDYYDQIASAAIVLSYSRKIPKPGGPPTGTPLSLDKESFFEIIKAK